MSDFDRLKKLNPDEVFQKTYIPQKVFKKLLQKDFASLGNRTKVLGLIKILEDRFGLDLEELKASAQEYFDTHENQHVSTPQMINEPNQPNIYVWIFIIMVALIGGGFYFWQKNGSTAKVQEAASFQHETFLNSEKNQSNEQHLAVRKDIDQNRSEQYNTQVALKTQDTNETNITEENNAKEEAATLPQIIIIPKKRLWVGIWYLDNHKRKNYITTNPIEINTSRDQLIMTGHGLFQVDIDGNITDFTSRHKVRFLYRAGELEKIDKKTFELYSKGRK